MGSGAIRVKSRLSEPSVPGSLGGQPRCAACTRCCARRSRPATSWTAGISWARRCRLPAFKRLGATLREHRDGIIEHFRSGLSNGHVEAMNAQILAAKARAKGYATHKNLIAISYLLVRQAQASATQSMAGADGGMIRSIPQESRESRLVATHVRKQLWFRAHESRHNRP